MKLPTITIGKRLEEPIPGKTIVLDENRNIVEGHDLYLEWVLTGESEGLCVEIKTAEHGERPTSDDLIPVHMPDDLIPARMRGLLECEDW